MEEKQKKQAARSKARKSEKQSNAPKGKKRKASKKQGFQWPGLLKSPFYRVYFPVVLAALIAIALWLNHLNGIAADYELAQPIHTAEEVARLFETGDYDAIYALDTSAQEIAEGDQAFYVQSLREVTAGKTLAWNETASPNEDEQVYNVTLDGGKFASFTLVPSGETTPQGRRLWKLGSITTNLVKESDVPPETPAEARFRVKAPSGYTVSVDGAALTQADVIQSTPLFEEGFLPKSVEAPMMVEYGFHTTNDAPAVTVTDASGAQAEVRQEGDGAWACDLKENAEFKQNYSDAIVKLAQRVAKYTSQDLSQGALMGSVASDSPAEETLKRFNNTWAPTHKDVRFENFETSDFHVLSDKCFTCHVSFDFIIISVRNNEYPYHTEYTFCVTKGSDGGKLYNLLFH